ncbi:MAG: glucose-6-phosphate isomerase [Hyphomicrobiaceae bacterium]
MAPTTEPYSQSIEGCLASALGRHGLERGELSRQLAALEAPLDQLRRDAETGAIPLLAVPRRDEDIAPAEAAMRRLAEGASTIVFLGTGGSSLGGQTLAQISGWGVPGETCGPRPRVLFFDNLDALSLERFLGVADLPTCRFVAISKSGGTAETLVQTIAALSAVRARHPGLDPAALFLGLTEPDTAAGPNGLKRLLAGFNIATLDHDPGVGGRFSVLTNVGLLPAIAMGLDPRAVRRGAAGLLDRLRSCARPADFPPAVGAAVAVALASGRGVVVEVMMPYADRLERFAAWFAQLWAESLGKQGRGTTPLAALGPVDQHSQLQLLMDGPRHHLITVLREASPVPGPIVEGALAAMAGIDYLAGRSIGDLVAAQSRAIPDALIGAGRPVRVVELARIDEECIGALLMHFMLETILAARLIGIDPFDQPAVEIGKRLARKRLTGPA